MLIKLRSSRLFDTSPSKRFAKKYSVEEDLWTEMWKRYKVLGYTIPDLADYFHIKAKRPIKRRYIKKWLFLTEIYVMSKPARDMNAQVINTCMFGDLEEQVIEEITRHLKDGSTSNSRIMA